LLYIAIPLSTALLNITKRNCFLDFSDSAVPKNSQEQLNT